MNTLPLVTCITPTYGRFDLLNDMLWCWTTQTYENKELIIVNDQENLTIVCHVPNVKIINIQERFVGLGAKRNFTIEQASPESEFICPFDDDDLFFPEHISFLMQDFFIYPELQRTRNTLHFVSVDGHSFNISNVSGNTYFGASCFRRKVFMDHKLNDHFTMGEDTSFFEKHGLSTHMIDNPLKSSFIYRRGMGIPHASEITDMTNDIHRQSEISKAMMNVKQYPQPTTRELIPELRKGKVLYDKVDAFRRVA
jgi:glycosyltransferase involved in cell wall biosynthesis